MPKTKTQAGTVRGTPMLPVTWPQGESLGDAVERVRPVWEDEVMPDLLEGKTVLMCAAGSTVRGFVRMIDGLDDGEIAAYCAAHKWPPEDLVATYLAGR